jgi:YgiT-type zinc finger domain-containing protein
VVRQRVVQARFHFKGRTIYVDHVPAWVCSKCGEQYFDAPVYKRLEAIARKRGRIKKTICFPLAEYDTALA